MLADQTSEAEVLQQEGTGAHVGTKTNGRSNQKEPALPGTVQCVLLMSANSSTSVLIAMGISGNGMQS